MTLTEEHRSIPGILRRSPSTLLLIAFLMGLAAAYFVWGFPGVGSLSGVAGAAEASMEFTDQELLLQINPPEGFTLPATYGDIGPALLAAGVIDLDKFTAVYLQAGQPLSDYQLKVLLEGSDDPIVMNRQNAHFLLNFFWALGLANENNILTAGPMAQNGADQVGRFASVGGWTIGRQEPAELYASQALVKLTPEQQRRVEQAAAAIYRPCCSNPTIFPDCNHGMAMLGLLELMAYQGASLEEMLEAAKYVTAFWFPEKTLMLARYHLSSAGAGFADIQPRQVVGPDYMSAYGIRQVEIWLDSRGLLHPPDSNGGGCGV
ncbi:MAG: hypothetical protein HYZ26_10940 [Chloroflexi bacterium]|nr:hypothetical protein [Chloroflexota bacterium]